MYHLQASLGGNLNESFARRSSDFSFIWTSVLSSMNVKALIRITKVSWWINQ